MRRQKKTIDRRALPTGADLAAIARSVCDHCNRPKESHPIVNPDFPKRSTSPYLCALDYSYTGKGGPLPFSVRELTPQDKTDLQLYLNHKEPRVD